MHWPLPGNVTQSAQASWATLRAGPQAVATRANMVQIYNNTHTAACTLTRMSRHAHAKATHYYEELESVSVM